MSAETHIEVPADGAKIVAGEPTPDNPIVPYIEGDGIGADITPVMKDVVDAAVERSYGGERRIHWMEIYAGEKATSVYGSDIWLPEETLATVREYAVSIKGPLTTPVGGGIRSSTSRSARSSTSTSASAPCATSRCAKPAQGPVQDGHGHLPRELRGHLRGNRVGGRHRRGEEGHRLPPERDGSAQDPLPQTSSIGVKPVSREGTERLVRRAIEYAIANGRDSVTLVHKGNIMKFTEGGFRDWGYALARSEFEATPIDGGPWLSLEAGGRTVTIKDVIADAFLQQILLRPAEYDVIATLNLNGDYISDWLPRSAESGSHRGRTSPTRSRCSRPRTGRRRSTRARTR